MLPPASAASHTCTSSTHNYFVCDRHSPHRTHCRTRALSHDPTPPLLLPSHNGRSVYTLWCTWCTLSSAVECHLIDGNPLYGRCPQQGESAECQDRICIHSESCFGWWMQVEVLVTLICPSPHCESTFMGVWELLLSSSMALLAFLSRPCLVLCCS